MTRFAPDFRLDVYAMASERAHSTSALPWAGGPRAFLREPSPLRPEAWMASVQGENRENSALLCALLVRAGVAPADARHELRLVRSAGRRYERRIRPPLQRR